MGYKSALRSIGSIARQIERDSIRRQKELVKQQMQYNKMQELERASYEVDVYENLIERLTTLHTECSNSYNWDKIIELDPPKYPDQVVDRQNTALANLKSYKPSFFDKLFRVDVKKHIKLEQLLEKAIADDEVEFKDSISDYNNSLNEYNDITKLAKDIIKGNIVSYKKAVTDFSPLKEISDIGSSLEFGFESNKRAIVVLNVHGEKVIPRQTKSLLKSGKLSVKDTPVGKYNELYQDYVCSSALRIGRELFALLPIEEIVVNVKAFLLNSVTGKMENQIILSVLFIKDTFNDIDFLMIDPSDSMKNFKHNMEFKKSVGMSKVKEIG